MNAAGANNQRGLFKYWCTTRDVPALSVVGLSGVYWPLVHHFEDFSFLEVRSRVSKGRPSYQIQ